MSIKNGFTLLSFVSACQEAGASSAIQESHYSVRHRRVEKSAWDTCSSSVCSFYGSLNPDFFCSFISSPAASACHPHTQASSLSHWLGGQKESTGHTTAGFSDQLEGSWQDFPHILLYSALKQQSRAVASSKAVLAQPGNLWSILNTGLVA